MSVAFCQVWGGVLVVSNGLSLCWLHRAAFGTGIKRLTRRQKHRIVGD